jgi:transcription elongation factor Elf1
MRSSTKFVCPVCGYAGLSEPPVDEKGCASFEICPSCGTEFGYDDAKRSHADLRNAWLSAGAPWRSRATQPPPGWSGLEQLRAAGFK